MNMNITNHKGEYEKAKWTKDIQKNQKNNKIVDDYVSTLLI